MNKKWLAGLLVFRMVTVVIAIVLIVTVIPHSDIRSVVPEAAAQSSESAAAVSMAPNAVSLSSTLLISSVKIPSSATDTTVSPAAAADRTAEPDSFSNSKSTYGSKPRAASKAADKVVYLTFDDGPSKWTDDVLDILKKADVPATFFMLGEQAKRFPEIVNRINEAGHSIGNHTYNHKYDELYSSFGVFWSQIKETEEVLRNITGTRTPLVRAPGGTYGHFDANYFKLLEQGGYKVFDWNLDSGDSKRKGVPASEIVKNVISAKQGNSMNVLMHDGAGHEETVKALPKIIEYYKSLGYEFRAITPEDTPVQFAVAPKIKNSKRPLPSDTWIQAHVVPNAALFGSGAPLYVEAGGVETRLMAGEYELKNGQYQVPLRTVMERLGAEVRWNDKEQTAIISWREARITIHLPSNTLIVEAPGEVVAEYAIDIDRKSGLIWLPLRTLLEVAGHDIVSVTSNSEERRVRAS